jgi:hypothetical protein
MTIRKPVKIAPGYDNSDWKALKLDRALSFSLQPHVQRPDRDLRTISFGP